MRKLHGEIKNGRRLRLPILGIIGDWIGIKFPE